MEKRTAIRYQVIILSLIFIPFILGWIFWGRLPEEVPIHWDGNGNPDGYGHKAINLFMIPGITLAINGLFWILPYVDPKKNISQFVDTLRKYQIGLNAFMLILYLTILSSTLGYEVPVDQVIAFSMFGLFALMGNYFGKLRPNHFVGLRLPWTLEDEDNWNKTHRFAGRLWLIGSVLAAIVYYFLIPVNLLWILFPFIGMVVVPPMIYSYWLYQNKQ